MRSSGARIPQHAGLFTGFRCGVVSERRVSSFLLVSFSFVRPIILCNRVSMCCVEAQISFTHSLIHSHARWLTHWLARPLSHSATCSIFLCLTHSHIISPTHSDTSSIIHSLSWLLPRLLGHSVAHLLTVSLAHTLRL